MSLATLWAQLEQDAPTGQTGRVERSLHPETDVDLYATVQLRGPGAPSRRALELVIATDVIETLEPPPSTRLVEVGLEPRPQNRTAVVIALDDPAATELFAAMCQDVADSTSAAADQSTAVGVFCGRFERWRRLLKGGPQGLPPHRQRGLYAELLCLHEQLAPIVGIDEAILAWLGPEGAPRDFEIDNLGIEVKSSAANEPQVVLINGERQLDDHGLRGLVLVHRSLEVLRDGHPTLPELVAQARRAAAGHQAHGVLEERLVQSGYHDTHEPLYRRTGYAIRRTSLFNVDSHFPRITEADLPDAVGDVRYSLAIDACRDHEIADDALRALLEQ